MAFRKGDRVQAGTRPEVFTAIKDEQPSGTLKVMSADGRTIRLHTLRHGVKPAPRACPNCGATARNDGSDYNDVCSQWPRCEAS